MKSFDIKTKIYFGDNAMDRVREIPYSRILIITDKFFSGSSMLRIVTQPLSETNKEFRIFNDVVPDPPVEKIVNGVKVVLDYKPDCLIAVGGGSVIDSAKAIREFAVKMETGLNIALIAIPTTSGTGSEVTAFSVITDTANHMKYPLVSDSMLPDEAILDEELVKSVPPNVTADTGMDVLTHAIEAYTSINNNEFSAALAEKSVEICGAFLMRAYLDGNGMPAVKCTWRPVWRDWLSIQPLWGLTTAWRISWARISIFRTAARMQCFCRTSSNTTAASTYIRECRNNIPSRWKNTFRSPAFWDFRTSIRSQRCARSSTGYNLWIRK